MDFRFDTQERGLLAEAGASFRRWLPADRLVSPSDASDRWRGLCADGWLDVATHEDSDEGLSLAVVAGIGREAGRVAAGDGFVSNAVLIRSVDRHDPTLDLPPGYLISDGNGTTQQPAGDERQWSFGIEPGLVPYRLDSRGSLTQYEATDWRLEPVAALVPQIAIATRASGGRPTTVGTAQHDEAALLTRARIIHAATLVGLGETMNNDAITYSKQRVQFGGPIGRFQAVKHLLAESAVALEIAWNATLFASMKPEESTADIAQIQAQRAVDIASRNATQVFGGIAITWEHHLHVLIKCAQTSRMRFGGTDRIAARIGARVIKDGALV